MFGCLAVSGGYAYEIVRIATRIVRAYTKFAVTKSLERTAMDVPHVLMLLATLISGSKISIFLL